MNSAASLGVGVKTLAYNETKVAMAELEIHHEASHPPIRPDSGSAFWPGSDARQVPPPGVGGEPARGAGHPHRGRLGIGLDAGAPSETPIVRITPIDAAAEATGGDKNEQMGALIRRAVSRRIAAGDGHLPGALNRLSGGQQRVRPRFPS